MAQTSFFAYADQMKEIDQAARIVGVSRNGFIVNAALKRACRILGVKRERRASKDCGTKTIYLLTCAVTGRRYVGQAGNVATRWAGHVLSSRKGMTPIARAIRAYGFAKFSVQELEVVPAARADLVEQKWIRKLGTLEPNGNNATTGGKNCITSFESGRRKAQRLTERAASKRRLGR